MTPRELISMLAKWDLDEEIDVSIQHRGTGDISVILIQGSDTINLTGED
jgi:hypothetical protein